MSYYVDKMLDAVNKWQEGCFLLRETTFPETIKGRIDGLLVPCNFPAHYLLK